jgi:hypothetical protein
MNRKREGWVDTPKLYVLHRPLACNKIHQKAEIAGEVAKVAKVPVIKRCTSSSPAHAQRLIQGAEHHVLPRAF